MICGVYLSHKCDDISPMVDSLLFPKAEIQFALHLGGTTPGRGGGLIKGLSGKEKCSNPPCYIISAGSCTRYFAPRVTLDFIHRLVFEKNIHT
jgi:hypothetical protein